MKVAIYSGTRNVYSNMLPSMKSLLMYSDVDKIYFLIEDDEFPYELPLEVECINISNQKYFSADGPNTNNRWTYMILLRAVYSKLFPQLDKVLCLDYDIIFTNNVSDLWDIPIDEYYFAAVKEPKKSTETKNYINTGVLLMNLKKIREDKVDDKLQYELNNYLYFFPEQDCINNFFSDKIYLLNPKYNVSKVSDFNGQQAAFHYCWCSVWKNLPLVKYYENLEYKDIKRNKVNEYILDIIIPFFNKDELIKTLKSINFELSLTVTCINNIGLDCDDIKQNFPKVQFLSAPNNFDINMMRQYCIDNTNNYYITFLNQGDYFLSNKSLQIALEDIKNNDYYYVHSYPYYMAPNNNLSNTEQDKLLGNIYKRDFLKLYNLIFIKGINEYGFIRSVFSILTSLNRIEERIRCKQYALPLLKEKENKNMTISDYVTDGIYIYNKQKENKIELLTILNEITRIVIRLESIFIINIKLHPENKIDDWKILLIYYNTVCKQYNRIYLKTLLSYNKSSEIIKHIARLFDILENYKDYPIEVEIC